MWGNRPETLIVVNPGTGARPGDFTPVLTSICNVALCGINQTSGWVHAQAIVPSAARVSMYGIIPGTPLFTWPLPPQPKYRARCNSSLAAFPWGYPRSLRTRLPSRYTWQIGGDPIASFGLTQNAVGGYFTYQDLTANPGQGWQIISLAVRGSGAPTRAPGKSR